MNLEKEKRAITYLRTFQPEEDPYYLCYSGGKDSDCIRILAQLAGVRCDIVHNLTTVDAPETMQYIKTIPEVQIETPKLSMWDLIEKKQMPPTRKMRYCCTELKEIGGKGRLKITGVRWAESPRRKENGGLVKIIGKPKTTQKKAEESGIEYSQGKMGGLILNQDNAESRRFVEQCYRTTATLLNPIVDWTDVDVWEFLGHYGCKSNPLYQCGMKRIGCIGCPLAGYKKMKEGFARYPKYKQAYTRAFDRMLLARIESGKETREDQWENGEEVMRWWLGEREENVRDVNDRM